MLTQNIDIENGLGLECVNEKIMKNREEYHKDKHSTSYPQQRPGEFPQRFSRGDISFLPLLIHREYQKILLGALEKAAMLS